MKQLLMRVIVFISLFLFSLQGQASQYDTETLTDKLSTPWAIAILPDNSLLITEREGRLRHFNNGQLSEPISGVPASYFAGQGGLLDVLIPPDFVKTRQVFLSLAAGNADSNSLAIVSAFLNEKANALEQVKTIFSVVPGKDTPVHYGARMTLMPDNTLLLASGDGFDYREMAQRKDSLLGKVIRINLDGSVPQDNPFADETGSELTKYIWSIGHRNPQALFYDEKSALTFSHEHGPAGGDEINIIEPGKNYGWPVITNGKDYSGANISPFRTYPGMQQPQFDWTPSVAPSDMILYRGDTFAELNEKLIVTTLKNREVQILSFVEDKLALQNSILNELNERFRAVEQDKKGNILLLTDSGKLLKLKTKQ